MQTREVNMVIREKKGKYKEDLRLKILEAAKSLFLKEGYEATSIRRIAAAINFSPTTIYLYYEDKTSIAYALQQEGFKLLRSRFSSLQHVDDPFERFKAMGRSYLQFAIENPDFYELMFVMKEPLGVLKPANEGDEPDVWSEGVATFDFLVDSINSCQKAGYFKGQDPRVFSFLVWSTMHGICTLNLHGHLELCVQNKLVDQEVNQLLDNVLESFISMMSKLKQN